MDTLFTARGFQRITHHEQLHDAVVRILGDNLQHIHVTIPHRRLYGNLGFFVGEEAALHASQRDVETGCDVLREREISPFQGEQDGL